MNPFYFRLLIGALSGLVTAIAVDLNAWAKQKPERFDWKLALKRYVSGAVTGATLALGMDKAEAMME